MSAATVAPGIALDKQHVDTPAEHEDWVVQLVRQASASGFYGDLRLTFHAGSITVARVDQSLKPPKANGG